MANKVKRLPANEIILEGRAAVIALVAALAIPAIGFGAIYAVNVWRSMQGC